MTAADFGDKQVVSNQSNSTISGEILVLQHMYLGRKGNTKILIKFSKYEKQHWRRVIHGTYDLIMVTHKTHGQNIQIRM
jgi:hypothetical protein